MILEALRRHGPLAERAIHGLFSRNKPAAVIRSALDRLADEGTVRCRQESTGGRSARIWEAR